MSQPHTNDSPRLVRACRNDVLDRPPVWLMRQAGRYMAEYQAIRARVNFLELCKTPDLAVEVSLQPYRAFGMDGVIMFSDILTVPEAMGMELTFTDKGPVFPNPLAHPDDLNHLVIPDPVEKTGFVMETLRQLRRELASDPETALIGFAGAPWTLATYMIEGGTSRNFTKIKTWLYNHPKALSRLLDDLAEAVTLYLNAQIEAGAEVIQLFDTWGGILSAEEYRRWILPTHQRIIENLNRDRAPVILFVNNSRGLLPLVAEANPDVVSVDATTSLTEARELVGDRYALQGNLDSSALFADPDVLKARVTQTLTEGGNKGYVFNLGHGILPATPVENVRLLVDTVKASALDKMANKAAASS